MCAYKDNSMMQRLITDQDYHPRSPIVLRLDYRDAWLENKSSLDGRG